MMIYKHNEGVPIDDFKQMLMKEYKMSIIEWQTGVPTKSGRYIVTTSNKCVLYAYYIYDNPKSKWRHIGASKVIAWCPLSDIEPYKK